MAQKVQVVLTCDLHEAETPAVETVSFGYDGYTYAFELCQQHLNEFGEVMQSYVGAARRTDGGGRRSRSGGRSASVDLGTMRSWARDNGYEISDRGRIPSEIRDAYEAANGK